MESAAEMLRALREYQLASTEVARTFHRSITALEKRVEQLEGEVRELKDQARLEAAMSRAEG